MPKFFVEENQLDIENKKVYIIGEDINHIKNVLRLNEDDIINIGVKSNTPKNYKVKIEKFEQEKIQCLIIDEIKKQTEAPIGISIFQGIPKSDKMETIIQKGTEIGVKEFIPLELKRCIAKIEAKDETKKILRWQKIAEVASKQSGRDVIPIVRHKMNLQQFCNIINEFDCVLVAYENEDKINLKQILRKENYNTFAIVIGPEGGFDTQEIEILKNHGARIISLGNRILRTETAPIVLSSIIMYENGDVGGKND